MRYLPDHGLPMVQLKEQRRDLVVALKHRKAPITDDELLSIAALQQAITAFEEVISDLDAEFLEAARQHVRDHHDNQRAEQHDEKWVRGARR